ncbi:MULTISPECIES: winged helix-turn-helix transcriptional regulator [unclassified Streptomyces]|uniref:winged helix-turn-helix transcriptional regulator n=1 Tax=unclassified Streptomyces TaxID=2593676 RepID=UPI0022566A15|nr:MULTISPECIES: winged helix-turn-helix transcriptional regulator [unclassified Streptomyces]WSP54482.1 winged helix-turn-helix transcriptional regulator [Streptomyces sp. NBC_01241]WSU24842.1 winged helix-turn-helix transcriptional regulator [Streptomyces sp. NBC_01108]MCX4786018.1 winged helix-turn-helix transcriptional regulator [Streptomyces sp. NBC_01221]MCX4798125.1 winged helix-turn-helix transcriptional regulator [Streptomyces sp. NBC_01242]WSJ39376.1 winged helix-turn-helix transcrip
MPRQQQSATRPARRRSYDQFCATARSLDSVGDRWTLLIVRELLAGPRRYTDLHADLPGVSTDVLASRLKDMEQGGLATRRRLPPPAAASVYELTGRGRGLLPVLAALAEWGAPALTERRPTDAVRAHWFALPLLRALDGLTHAGVVEVQLDEGEFHVRAGGATAGGAGDSTAAEAVYGDGPADHADARIALDVEVCLALGRGELTLAEAVKDGRIEVSGDGPLVAELRGE